MLPGSQSVLRGALALLVGVLPASAQIELGTLRVDDGSTLDLAGAAVAASGDLVVVGAPEDDEGGEPTGAAYVYRRTGTTLALEQKLTGSTSNPRDAFGTSVAVSGTWIAVGAPDDDDTGPQAGTAFLYRHDGVSWVEEQIVTSDDGTQRAGFGTSAAMQDDVLVIGAPGDSEPQLGRGSATVFRRAGGIWASEQDLIAPDGTGQDNLGASVAVSGDVIVVGAPGDQDLGSYSGSAYAFGFDGASWSVVAKLRSPGSVNADFIGISVAISGDVIAVGASQDDTVAHDAGAVATFRFDGASWLFEQELIPSAGEPNGQFGRSLAFGGEDRLFVGAPYAATTGTVSTWAHDGASWNEQATAGPADGAGTRDVYGWSLAMADGGLVVGATGDSVQAPSAGAAHVIATDWNELADALAGTHGDPRLIGAGGLEGGGNVALGLTNALENSSAAWVVGLAELGAPLKGGVLVPDPFLVIPGLPTDASGSLTVGAGWPPGVPSGTMLWFQAWVADPAGPAGFSASNGLSATAP